MSDVEKFNLTAGRFRILGNKGDEYPIVLNNDPDKPVIIMTGEIYKATFTGPYSDVETIVELNQSNISNGVLTMQIVCKTGTYRVSRTNPTRTLLLLEVEAE